MGGCAKESGNAKEIIIREGSIASQKMIFINKYTMRWDNIISKI